MQPRMLPCFRRLSRQEFTGLGTRRLLQCLACFELYKIYLQQTNLHLCASLRTCHAVSKYAHVRFVKKGIPLYSERPDPTISTTDVLQIQIVQIPSQSSEP